MLNHVYPDTMDETKITMCNIEFVYYDDENQFYDIFVEYAGVRQTRRIRVEDSPIPSMLEHILELLTEITSRRG